MSSTFPAGNIVEPRTETTLEGRLNVEARWFNVSMFVVTLIGGGLAVANAVFYDKIRKNKGCGSIVSEAEATTFFWINVILAVIFIILAIWALARALTSREYRVTKTQQLKAFVTPVAPGVRTFRPAPTVTTWRPRRTRTGERPQEVGKEMVQFPQSPESQQPQQAMASSRRDREPVRAAPDRVLVTDAIPGRGGSRPNERRSNVRR